MSSSFRTSTVRPSLRPELTGIRIHVVSHEPVVRAGIRTLLASRSDGLEFVDDLTRESADVVFYDVIGLRRGGGQDLRAVLERHPGRVLALARTQEPGLTARAFELGVTAAVPLSASSSELVAAIHDLQAGRFRDGSPTDLANQRDRDHRLGHDASLSPRERQVLSLIVAGASNREIAAELTIAPDTVKSFIRVAYAKIGVTRRSQAVAWGIEHGFPTKLESP